VETLLALLAWIVFGIIVGFLARALMPGRQSMGLMTTMALGVVGSLAGGLITWAVTGANDPYAPAQWIMSIVGAIVVMVLFGVTRRRTAP